MADEVSKLLSLAVLAPPGVSDSKLLGLSVVAPPGTSDSKLLGLVVLVPLVSCGPIPVFPSLPAGFPIKIRPTFKTTIGTASSGREVRWRNQQLSLWEIELNFDELRSQTQNDTIYEPLAGFLQYEELVQHWLMMYGQFGLFYFDAPWDDSRANSLVGTGDGVTLEFIVPRVWGAGTAVLSESVGGLNEVFEVDLDGVPVDPATYSVAGSRIVFETPPGSGVQITATFSFFYLCRFRADEQDFDEFSKNRWTVPSLRFRSVYWPGNQVFGAGGVAPPPPPPPPPGLRLTINILPLTPTIPDNTPLGTLVATVTVTRSDGAPFSGTLTFGSPNGDDGGRFVLSGVAPGPYSLSLNPSGPGLPSSRSTENVTLTATN